MDRVGYYNKLSGPFTLDETAKPFRFNLFGDRRNYQFDLLRYTRHFDPAFRLHYLFGDITTVPAVPGITKARPICGNNAASVLLNLNKVRHFVFVDDPIAFRKKRDQVVWRGNAYQQNRKEFLKSYMHHPACDVGHAHKRKRMAGLEKPYLSIQQQLKYKYVLSLEGNDVASNLKWIMSSNSLCFMTKPRYETWYMEGRLIPDYHYVLLQDDFSDLEAKLDYFRENPEAAEAIIKQANLYTMQFRHDFIEDVVSILVLEKYFRLSGQIG